MSFGILERLDCVNSASTVQKRSFSYFTEALHNDYIYSGMFFINPKSFHKFQNTPSEIIYYNPGF
jgi:hypothetical protein